MKDRQALFALNSTRKSLNLVSKSLHVRFLGVYGKFVLKDGSGSRSAIVLQGPALREGEVSYALRIVVLSHTRHTASSARVISRCAS